VNTELPGSPVEMPRGGLRKLLSVLGARDQFGNPAPTHNGAIVIDNGTSEGQVYLKNGRVTSVSYTGFTPPLARRMHTTGLISAATAGSLTNTPADLIEKIAIREYSVSVDDIEDINRQMVLSSLAYLYNWSDSTWRWDEGASSDLFAIHGIEPGLIVSATDERLGQWEVMQRNFPDATNPDAIPKHGPDYTEEMVDGMHPEMSAVLRHVDGNNTVRHIASICGLTRFELAGRLAQAAADATVAFPAQDEGDSVDAKFDVAPRVPDDAATLDLVARYTEALDTYKASRLAYVEAERVIKNLATQLRDKGHIPPPASTDDTFDA
jgi:hypothetical protein